MSYVLDALRKSEHERQQAAGRHASMLYPLVVEQNRMLWLWPAMLGGAVIAAVVIALFWWLSSRPPAPEVPATPAKPVAAVAPQTPPSQLPVPAPRPALQKRTAAPAPQPKPVVAASPAPVKPAAVPVAKPQRVPAKPAVSPASAEAPTETEEDPLKDMPPLEISGYMRDEHAGSMAIINDQLVREGDEIAPGLRLEKILSDGAIFDYKGHQFRR